MVVSSVICCHWLFWCDQFMSLSMSTTMWVSAQQRQQTKMSTLALNHTKSTSWRKFDLIRYWIDCGSRVCKQRFNKHPEAENDTIWIYSHLKFYHCARFFMKYIRLFLYNTTCHTGSLLKWVTDHRRASYFLQHHFILPLDGTQASLEWTQAMRELV